MAVDGSPNISRQFHRTGKEETRFFYGESGKSIEREELNFPARVTFTRNRTIYSIALGNKRNKKLKYFWSFGLSVANSREFGIVTRVCSHELHLLTYIFASIFDSAFYVLVLRITNHYFWITVRELILTYQLALYLFYAFLRGLFSLLAHWTHP